MDGLSEHATLRSSIPGLAQHVMQQPVNIMGRNFTQNVLSQLRTFGMRVTPPKSGSRLPTLPLLKQNLEAKGSLLRPTSRLPKP